MINKILFILIFIGLAVCLNGCKDPETKPIKTIIAVIPQDSIPDQVEEKEITFEANMEVFLKNLKEGKNVNSSFANNWTFVYYKYSRIDGSTKGEIENLKSDQIDTIIQLKVFCDGKGWDIVKSRFYMLDFDLKEQLKKWDRIEISNIIKYEKGIVSIRGSGESDYILLKFNTKGYISILEYYSVDPG